MRIATAILISMFFATSAVAQTACETQAVGKDGKPLTYGFRDAGRGSKIGDA